MTKPQTWHGQPLPPADPAPRTTGQRSGQQSPSPGERAAPGTVIGGRYALRTAIGHGGMGTVWRASDTLLRRDVAVKEVLLPPGIADNEREQMYQRTLREARAAAALSHPAVVQVYDVVTEAGRPWIVMELLQSRSLAEMIIEDGPLAPRAVAKTGIALLGALEVAHAAGVLHRDVKPANVLICSDGRCVLTDFGVARMPTDSQLTTPGMVLGSPHFISPERAIGAKFGPPSDLFSLGVTLYTAVEGRPPFDKRDPFETMRAVVEEPPVPPLRAGSLTGVLYGLLEKEPDRRWTIPATRRVLRELLAGPLASSAAAHVTDPYAVVRPTPFVPPPAEPPPSGKIGGTAMLAPGESISSAIRRRQHQDAGAPAQPAGQHQSRQRADLPTAATALASGVDPQTTPIRPGHNPGRPGIPDLSRQPQPALPTPAELAPGLARRVVTTPRPPAQRGGAHSYQLPPAVGRPAEPLLRRAGLLIRSVPPVARVAAAAGVATVLLCTVGMAAGWFGDDSTARPRARSQTSVSPSGPGFPTQEYRDDTRGIRVNVPASWTKSPTRSYVDFLDPADPARRLRINVEPASGTARGFLEVAERGLQKGTGQCGSPYHRIDLRDLSLDGRPGAELEYTCGTGSQLRHGIWAAFVRDGSAYEFFVSVPDSRFSDSLPIYREMARSYHLVG